MFLKYFAVLLHYVRYAVTVAREKVTAIVTSMKTLCLRDILWNRLLWSEVSDEYEARRRRRTGDEDFRDPVSNASCC